MHRFALLDDGNLMLLNSTLRILPCPLSNFFIISVWVRHGLPNTVIYYLVQVACYASATVSVFRPCCYKFILIVRLICISVVMVSPGLHHLTQCMGTSFRLLAGFVSPVGDTGQTWAAVSPIMCFYSHLIKV